MSSRYTILAVDDSKTNLTVIKEILSEKYDVLTAINGAMALKFLEKKKPDLVLLDLLMPEMDGREVFREIRKNPDNKDLPIIFLTADQNEGTEVECLKLGASDFITKPIVPEVLLMRISKNIELEEYHRAMRKEKELMSDTFGKVVDPGVRDFLMKGNAKLGGEIRETTIMFCDIRSFTAMSETMEPSAVVSLLNEYFTALEKCIASNGGIINKYIGDAVMAIFGAPVESDNHAMDALNASLDMRMALKKLNADFLGRGLPEIKFGIGLHSGKVLSGNIGAANRMEYTVIGDTVNTASRIESLCKQYKTDLLISENTLNMLPISKDDFTFVDVASIRGKEVPIKLFCKN